MGAQSMAQTSSACPGRSLRSFFLPSDQSLTVESLEAETMSLESLDHATQQTGPTCPRSTQMKAPLQPSQILRLLSKLAETMQRPSGEYWTWLTYCWCPVSLCTGLAWSCLQRQSVQSSLPETSLSGWPPTNFSYLCLATDFISSVELNSDFSSEKQAVLSTKSVFSAIEFTQCACPFRILTLCPFLFQTPMLVSSEAVQIRPSPPQSILVIAFQWAAMMIWLLEEDRLQILTVPSFEEDANREHSGLRWKGSQARLVIHLE